ncbi:MAG: hypothetical protein PHQ32_04285 [Firmicutes bacterium]|nr:hypothetical protein [Bacillota bacterium]
MFKKIVFIVVILAILSSGTVFAVDKYNAQQKIEAEKQAQLEKEAFLAREEQTASKIENKDATIISDPKNPNLVIKEWRGKDSLTYKVEATKNANGTYTGNIIGFNMYDNFVEYNFKFTELSQSGFQDLLLK